MTLIREQDFGTPARPGPATVRVEVDGREVAGPRGHVDHAGRRDGRRRCPQALRDRFAWRVRLVPAVPCRGGRPARDTRVVHDAMQ